jgi:beta-xylosidase
MKRQTALQSWVRIKNNHTTGYHSTQLKHMLKQRLDHESKTNGHTDSKEKDWETLIKRNSETAQSRKAEVAKFRLNTGHDLLGKHLKRFNIVDSDIL